MTRVVAFVPDLLFGSNVAGALGAAGLEVQLVPALPQDGIEADVLVVDLTAEHEQRISAVSELRAGAVLDGVRTLGFYSHVEADVRSAAEQAGFDLVVPRSRMAREGAALVARLARAG